MTEEQEKARQMIVKFGNGLLILGLLLGVFGVYFLFIGNETLRWPTVTGELINASVERHVSSDPNTPSATKRLETQYYVTLHYRYEVDGGPYFSSRYSFGNGRVVEGQYYQTQQEAQVQANQQYSSADAITVSYDPDDPSEAVFKPGWNLGTFAPLLIALFLGASGWFMRAVIRHASK